jgi:hypothetical protein
LKVRCKSRCKASIVGFDGKCTLPESFRKAARAEEEIKEKRAYEA